jgi:hypothetical protein
MAVIEFSTGAFGQPDSSEGSLGQGVGEIWMAKVEDFLDDTGIKTRYANPTTDEEQVSIDGTHEFKSGKGFTKLYHDPQNSETDLMVAMNGEGLGANSMYELTAFYPGKKYILDAFLQLRPQLILLAGDINCSSPSYVQVGSKCTPAWISAYEWGLKNINGQDAKGYRITFKAFSDGILNYSGTINEPS